MQRIIKNRRVPKTDGIVMSIHFDKKDKSIFKEFILI